MKVLITGGSGFIGQHLIPRISGPHELFALVRDERQLATRTDCTPVVSDLSRPLDHRRLPAEIDIIIHLAQANVPFPEAADELFAVNLASTQQLLDYARSAGAARFILASSGDVYGRRTGTSKESDDARPSSYYAVTKYASELLVIAYSHFLQPCILRFFHPYGSGQDGRLIPKLAARLRRDEPIQLNNEGGPHLSPIFIDDLCRAAELAMASSYCGVLNIAGDGVISMRVLAEEIGRVLDINPTFHYSGEEAPDMSGDNSLMTQVLGSWSLVGLADGLSRALKNGEGAGWETDV